MHSPPTDGGTLAKERPQIFSRGKLRSDFRKEWDFSGIASDELRACFVYEYARELTKQWPRLLRLLEIFRDRPNLPRTHPDECKKRRVCSRLWRIYGRRFGECPAFWFFPDTAWQNLAAKERLASVEHSNGHHVPPHQILQIGIFREVGLPNVASLEDFAYSHELFSTKELDQTEYGLLAVDWNRTDGEITTTFKSWLKEQRQARVNLGLTKINHRKTARGGVADKLSWLGALRVRNHYSPSELADYPSVDNPNRKLKVPAPYSYMSDLYEAANKAQRLINEIRAHRGPRNP